VSTIEDAQFGEGPAAIAMRELMRDAAARLDALLAN
jgi:hypothetical protein